ncbi:hypothetical protein KCMC57_up62540 [Kitasatospora sp. CMC57]|uniref:Uncharacterized protein n=1 Tax=Kitasatospora sp. CMC57 TaxID=3231513 RepID=A0AB33K2S6_9ACTN
MATSTAAAAINTTNIKRASCPHLQLDGPGPVTCCLPPIAGLTPKFTLAVAGPDAVPAQARGTGRSHECAPNSGVADGPSERDRGIEEAVVTSGLWSYEGTKGYGSGGGPRVAR